MLIVVHIALFGNERWGIRILLRFVVFIQEKKVPNESKRDDFPSKL